MNEIKLKIEDMEVVLDNPEGIKLEALKTACQYLSGAARSNEVRLYVDGSEVLFSLIR